MSLKAYRSTGRTHDRGMPFEAMLRAVPICEQRKCVALKRDGTPCGHVALRHVTVCRFHGGYGLLASKGLYRSQRGHAALDRGEAPSALRALPAWRRDMPAKQRRALVKAFLARGEAPEAWRRALALASAGESP
jgi:hypothetical protein